MVMPGDDEDEEGIPRWLTRVQNFIFFPIILMNKTLSSILWISLKVDVKIGIFHANEVRRRRKGIIILVSIMDNLMKKLIMAGGGWKTASLIYAYSDLDSEEEALSGMIIEP